jgi:uncharacterized protein (DUF1684 family)
LLLLLAAGCHAPGHDDRSAWRRWRSERIDEIGGPYGWASLSGLHWLEEGVSSSGSSHTNRIVLAPERAPAALGTWIRHGGRVRLDVAPAAVVRVNGRPFASGELATDAGGPPDVVSAGPIRITVIRRGERLGLRVRDPDSPARRGFRGIDCFDYDPRRSVPARLEPAVPGTTLAVADVAGGRDEMPLAGTLRFEMAGAEHSLLAVRDDETHDLFVMFRDATSGRETYGGGRFLHVAMPDASGATRIDFNRAYNPPCGYTPYATCPVPPPENRLPLAVKAGERRPPGGH